MSSPDPKPPWLDLASPRSVLGLCLVVAVLAGFLVIHFSTQQTAQEQELRRLQTISTILADYLQTVFKNADSATRAIESDFRETGPATPDAFRAFAASAERHKSLRLIALGSEIEAITLVDDRGQFKASSRSWPPPPINIADRDYFITSRDNPGITAFESGMLRNRVTGQRTMFWARRVACDNTGNFCGLILATLRTTGFQTFFSKNLPNPEATISVYRQDGSLLLTTPETESSIAASQAMGRDYVARMRDGGARVFVESGNSSNPDRLNALSGLESPRLIIAVTTSRAAAMQNWITFSNYLAIFAGVALLLAGLCWRAILQESRSRIQANERSDQLAEANAQLQTTIEALEAANHSLETFSYSISHDLRAPLRAIDGFAAILQDDLDPPRGSETGKLLDRIRDNSQRMARLLQNLLDLSRYSTVEMKRESIDMGAKVALVIAEMGPDSAAVKFEVGEMPQCHADRAMMWEVWTNLIGNAVKYSSKVPAPIVRIGFRDGAYFVEDNGTGFDMSYCDKLFKLFSRLHHEHDYAGTGIGLAVVKRIVERHGGKISAVGAPGNGATFSFVIPD